MPALHVNDVDLHNLAHYAGVLGGFHLLGGGHILLYLWLGLSPVVVALYFLEFG